MMNTNNKKKMKQIERVYSRYEASELKSVSINDLDLVFYTPHLVATTQRI